MSINRIVGRDWDRGSGTNHRVIRSDTSPPAEPSIEAALLGSMMRDGDRLDEIVRLTDPDQFFVEDYQHVAMAIWGQLRAGLPCDYLCISELMRHEGTFERLGGDCFLVELMEKAPSSANVVYWAGIVCQKYRYRCTIEKCERAIIDGYAQAIEVDHLIANLHSDLFTIPAGNVGQDVVTADQALKRLFEHIDGMEDGYVGLTTGWLDLDSILQGIHGGQFVVVGARTSVGKSAFVQNIALHMSRDLGKHVLLASVEMDDVAILQRLVMMQTGLPSTIIKNKNRSLDDTRIIGLAYEELRHLPLIIAKSRRQTMASIHAEARKLKRLGQLDIVIVDYLQKIDPDPRLVKAPMREQISENSRCLSDMAADLDVPVIAPAQLNRKVEDGKGDHRPALHHLKESGSIEQDADIVILLHRENTGQSGPVEVIVAKHRSGTTGAASLYFDMRCLRFKDLARHGDRLDGSDF